MGGVITNLDKINSILKYPTSLLKKIFENVSEGIMITDKHKKIEMVNPAFEFVTGYKRDEVIGKTPAVLQSGVHELSFYLTMSEKITTRRNMARGNLESS
ncbi:GGDEF domain-containing protein OS=Lysinibacillus sphaericus OX=1421 GN=LS41612_14800 PE=4 SV=1 [Lysinibacillus sphaericus]